MAEITPGREFSVSSTHYIFQFRFNSAIFSFSPKRTAVSVGRLTRNSREPGARNVRKVGEISFPGILVGDNEPSFSRQLLASFRGGETGRKGPGTDAQDVIPLYLRDAKLAHTVTARVARRRIM